MRTITENKRILRGEVAISGVAKPSVRHLGGRLNPPNSMVEERRLRVQAMRANWSSLGQFWYSDAPWRTKRTIFMGKVMGAGLTGLETNTLNQRDYEVLNRVLLGFLRSMMQGKAKTIKAESGTEGAGGSRIRTWSNAKIW